VVLDEIRETSSQIGRGDIAPLFGESCVAGEVEKTHRRDALGSLTQTRGLEGDFHAL
jgi:hypothetical protein